MTAKKSFIALPLGGRKCLLFRSAEPNFAGWNIAQSLSLASSLFFWVTANRTKSNWWNFTFFIWLSCDFQFHPRTTGLIHKLKTCKLTTIWSYVQKKEVGFRLDDGKQLFLTKKDGKTQKPPKNTQMIPCFNWKRSCFGGSWPQRLPLCHLDAIFSVREISKRRVGLQAVLVGSAVCRESVVFSRPWGGAGTPCDKGSKTSILQQLEKIRLPTRIASARVDLKAKKNTFAQLSS